MRDNPGDAIDVSSEDEDGGCFRGTRDSEITPPTVRSSYGTDRPTRARLSGRDASGAHSYLKYGTKMVNMG